MGEEFKCRKKERQTDHKERKLGKGHREIGENRETTMETLPFFSLRMQRCRPDRQQARKNRNRKEQKNRNREKDKRTNKHERAVLCLERSRHTSKTLASQPRSAQTYPLGAFPLQEPFQEPRNYRCISTRETRACLSLVYCQ